MTYFPVKLKKKSTQKAFEISLFLIKIILPCFSVMLKKEKFEKKGKNLINLKYFRIKAIDLKRNKQFSVVIYLHRPFIYFHNRSFHVHTSVFVNLSFQFSLLELILFFLYFCFHRPVSTLSFSLASPFFTGLCCIQQSENETHYIYIKKKQRVIASGKIKPFMNGNRMRKFNKYQGA